MLPVEDNAWIRDQFPDSGHVVENGMLCVTLPDFPLPAGLNANCADLLLRLPPGYPDAAPDMWWFDPAVLRADGEEIAQTQVEETHVGRTWQRWSRHLQADQWRPGIDSLESFVALVHSELLAAAS